MRDTSILFCDMIQEMEQMELNTRLRQSYQESASVPQKYYMQEAQEIPVCSSSVPCSSSLAISSVPVQKPIPQSPAELASWSTNRVCEWLESIGFDAYSMNFRGKHHE
jgi:hypothetical protein